MQPDHGLLIGMTVALARLDVESAVAEIAELGFEAVETHLLQLGPGLPGVPVFEQHAAAAGDAIRDSGFVVSTLNAAGAPGFEPLEDGEAAADELARQLRLAAAMGAPRVLCWDGRLPPGGDIAAAPRALAECIASARERSRLTEPPAVSVELHPFTFALAHDRVAELAEALDSVGAGICLDFCHFGVALGASFPARLTPEVLRTVNHVHLSDTDCVTSELHFPPGAGVLDLDALATLVRPLQVAVAWDLFGWPAPRTAARRGLPQYAHYVKEAA